MPTTTPSSPLLDAFPSLASCWVTPPLQDAADLVAAMDVGDLAVEARAADPEVSDVRATVDLASLLPLPAGALASTRIAIAGAVTHPDGSPIGVDCASAPVVITWPGLGEVTLVVALRTREVPGAADRSELYAGLTLGVPLTATRTVEVVGEVTGDPARVRLAGTVDGPPVSGLSALGVLLGPGMGEVQAHLHEPLTSLAALEVRSVRLELDRATSGLVRSAGASFDVDRRWAPGGGGVPVPAAGRLRVDLAVADPFGASPALRADVAAQVEDWEVVPGALELTEVSCWLTLDASRHDGRWAVSSYGGVAGEVALADGAATVHLPLPPTSDDWHLDLVSGDARHGSAALAGLLRAPLPGPLAALAGAIRVPHLGLVVTPTPLGLTRTAATLRLASPLPLVGGAVEPRVVLDAVEVDLTVDHPLAKPVVTGSIVGTLDLGPGAVRLAVHRLAESDPWAVSVGATQVELGTIGDVADSVAAVAGGPDWRDEVPQALADRTFTLTDLSLDYVLEPPRLDALGLELDAPANATGGLLERLGLRLSVQVDHHGEKANTAIAGSVEIGAHDFSLVLERGADEPIVAGTYVDTDRQPIDLAEILAAVAPAADDGRVRLDVAVADAFFAHGTGWEVVGADLRGRLDLSHLPMIGKALPVAGSIGLDLRAIGASADLDGDAVARVNAVLPPEIRQLPAGADATSVALHRGVSLLASMRVGREQVDLALPLDDSGAVVAPSEATGPPPPPSAVPVPTDSVHWIKVQRHFGPVHFARIGAALDGGDLTLALDAAVDVAGLRLGLDGLSVTTPVDRFDPTFRFRGIGIDYANGDIAIGGALLRRAPDDYAGAATITTPQLTLSALGAYAKVAGQPSLFVSAVLDAPIGGPAFLYVTGLSAAFGYNRSLRMPPVEGVLEFPLVEQALQGAGAPVDLDAEIAHLAGAIPVTPGESFLSVGLSFTSFQQIDSYVLLAVQFGRRTEIDLLGVSHLVAPAPVDGVTSPPLADIEIALRGRFVPGEVLGIEGRLTPTSYVLASACRLTGGFAFSTWFAGERAGDFVVSVGGYHPAFSPPTGYPVVPRVGFNWRVDPHVTIKGSGYYALTPHAAMAGGHLEATYHNGRLAAWFQLTLDLLLAWRPFHYEASASVHVGGSYTFHFLGTHTITVDLAAAVAIHGPEFSGHAELDLSVAKVSVRFGPATTPPGDLGWQQFTDSFLPAHDRHGVTVERGLVSAGGGALDLGVLSPSQLRLATRTAVPCSAITVNGTELGDVPGVEVSYPALGVGPCGLAVGDLTSTHRVSLMLLEVDPTSGEVVLDAATGEPVGSEVDLPTMFDLEPVTKSVPAALWGEPTGGRPRLDPSGRLVGDAVVGLRIVAKPPVVDAGVPGGRGAASAGVALPSAPETAAPADLVAVTDDELGRAASRAPARNRALAALGLDPTFVRVGTLPDAGLRPRGTVR
ncbi:DUF6603 domain-containing protein [Nocardioides sp. YIM 152588]|uniref:DUF6603 domain-containing protein n=1 Tax=Nocardioides sp. YIM 152588 TaxID=3158259 RepID=UPI0032E48666